MKKLGTISLMCAGFIAGIAFVYSCGGGGSSSGAATIEELEARVVALEAKLANVVINNNPLVGLSGPHFIFSGVNVHVRNGAAQSDTTNGVGNIIVGYNEAGPADSTRRTGSHNLVIGQQHEYSRYNGLVAGYSNRLEGVDSTVSGGRFNDAIGNFSSVSGGQYNVAGGLYSSVNGGYLNSAGGDNAAIGGGSNNSAGGAYASISGGFDNLAGGSWASISGGRENSAGAAYASISGGRANWAGGNSASVSGGYGNSATAYYQSDETPDYDSGWQSITANTDIDFVHNLGGSADDYTVVLDQKETGLSSTHGINNHYVGGDINYNPTRTDMGTFWVLLTNSSIKVWRNPDTVSHVDQVRIRIWAHKS